MLVLGFAAPDVTRRPGEKCTNEVALARQIWKTTPNKLVIDEIFKGKLGIRSLTLAAQSLGRT